MLQHIEIIFHRMGRIVFPFKVTAKVYDNISNVHVFHPAQ
jgi:hypothetical protein